MKKPSKQIREIWSEMKELKRMCEINNVFSDRFNELSEKYEEIEINFGRESTLTKAVIYYLDNQ